MRGHENIAKRPCSAQTGWSKTTQTRIPKHFGKSTTPSAPSEDASRYFLDVAATPPHGGEYLDYPYRSILTFIARAYRAEREMLQRNRSVHENRHLKLWHVIKSNW